MWIQLFMSALFAEAGPGWALLAGLCGWWRGGSSYLGAGWCCCCWSCCCHTISPSLGGKWTEHVSHIWVKVTVSFSRQDVSVMCVWGGWVCVWVCVMLIHTCNVTHMDLGTTSVYVTDWFGWGQWGVFDAEIIEWKVDLALKSTSVQFIWTPTSLTHIKYKPPTLSVFLNNLRQVSLTGELCMCTHMYMMLLVCLDCVIWLH